MTWVPKNWTEAASLLVAALLAAVLIRLWRPQFYPSLEFASPNPWFQPKNTYHVQLVEWERDRVLTAAKGTASAAAGYLTAVFTMVLKNEITAQVSVLTLIGTIVGAVGLLVLAFDLSVATRIFVAAP